MSVDEQKLERMIRSALFRFARKRRAVHEEDLCQAARLALVEAKRRLSANTKVYEGGDERYLWRTIVYAMNHTLWASEVAVSGGTHRPWVAYRGLRSCEFMSSVPSHTDAIDAMGTRRSSEPDEMVTELEWRKRVRERIARLAGSDAIITLLTLLAEETSIATVAAQRGVSVRRVKEARSRVLRAAANDQELKALMKERSQ